MTKNSKTTSASIASKASAILRDANASDIQKSLAASALSQRDGAKQTGAAMETKASHVLSSTKYAADTKQLAASLVSQANKDR